MAKDQRSSVFEDHQECLDDLLLFGCRLGDSFKLEAEISIGAAFVCAEYQLICAHLQSNNEPSNDVKRGL